MRGSIKQGNQVTIIDDFNHYYDPAIKRKNIAGFKDQITVIEGNYSEPFGD